MKITLARKELYEGLQIVTRAVSAQTSLPVLKNVLIQPGTDAIKLAATDLELAVEVLVPARVVEGGALTVPAKTFQEIVAALPESDVTLGTEEGEPLVISCLRSEFRIPGLSAEDFPPLPEVGGSVYLAMPQPVLREMIRQVALAASEDDTRPILTGVCLVLQENRLRLVATDTHRLALRNAEVTQATGDATVIVPARAMQELMRVLGDDPKEMVEVRVDQNQILFRTETVTLVSRLIEGQFPRYERVLPTEWTRRLTVGREDLAAAMRRARIVAREAAAKDQVVFSAGEDGLEISAQGAGGRIREELEATLEGEPIAIGFNGGYVSEVLGVLPSEGVFLELTEPLSPTVLRPADGDDYMMVIMPMQVQ